MKYLITIVAIGILFNGGIAIAQTAESLDDAKQIGEQLVEDSPNILKTAWRGASQALVKVWGYLEKIFGGIFKGIWNILTQEVEKRRPEAEQEFQNEIEEMKEDIPKTTKTLWERLKDLWK